MAKRSIIFSNLVGPGVVPGSAPSRSYVDIAPAYAFVDGTAINWPVPVRQYLTGGTLTVAGVEDTYLGQPVAWAFKVVFEDERGIVTGSYAQVKTFPVGTGAIAYSALIEVDLVSLPGFGPTWAEQAKASADAAAVSAAAAAADAATVAESLQLKANVASPTFTGTVSGVTKAHVGLGNVDNTSDADKPVSTSQATALGLKMNTADNDAAVAGYINAAGGSVTKTALANAYAPAVVLTGTGIDLTGATDCTTALRAKFTDGLAAGKTRFVGVPGATYKIAIPDSTSLAVFTGTQGVTVDLSNSKLDNSATSYTADTITPIFLIDGAKDTSILVGDYLGFTLATPDTDLGYKGATLVRAINGADGVTVDARATNLRYGLQTGDYGDAARGGCKNIVLRFRGSMVGYPLAAYRAQGIRHDLDVDGVHRVAYVAGCDDVRGTARYKDLYIAPIAYLITDAIASGTDADAQLDPVGAATTSVASTNVDVFVEDKGSTVFTANSHMVGISLSRVDPVAFRNINVRVYLKATNTLSTTVHAFSINSTANTIWSRYTYNWESTILLDNITIGGVVDKSALTVAGHGSSNGFVTLRTDDPGTPARFGTIRNLRIEDLLVRSSSTGGYTGYIYVRGLASPMVIDRLVIVSPAGGRDGYVLLVGNTVPAIFNQCSFATLDTAVVPTTEYILGPGTEVTATDADRTFRVNGGTVRGAGPRLRSKIVTTAALTGAAVTLVGAIPAGATDVRIQARVTTAITGASGFQVGVTGDVTKYANLDVVAAGSLVNPANHAATAYTAPTYLAATDLIVTAKVANFTAGVIRFFIHYWEYPNVAS